MRGGLRIVFDPAIDGDLWRGQPAPATIGEAWLGPLGLRGRGFSSRKKLRLAAM